jgi:hypothetical protein
MEVNLKVLYSSNNSAVTWLRNVVCSFVYNSLSDALRVKLCYVAFSHCGSYEVLLSFQMTRTNTLSEYRKLFSLSERCLPRVLHPMFEHSYQPECHIFLS